MKKIVLFASGNGSNVENIIQYFRNRENVKIVGVLTNNSKANVLERIKKYNVPSVVFNRTELNEGVVFDKVMEFEPDLIVLAGFLWKFPSEILKKFPNRVINIHPALLPKHGGKGMYGMYVHQAVLENKDPETGITIHYVNEHYDEGAIIFQKSVNIEDCTTPEEIAQKINILEMEHFPIIIDQLLSSNFQLPTSKS